MKLLPLAAVLIAGAACTCGRAADQPNDAASKASIKGQVLYAKNPAANIAVALDGPVKKVAKSDAKGLFAFEGLPPGDYTLEAEGTARNNIRKGNATITVPELPKKPEFAKKLPEVIIKLK